MSTVKPITSEQKKVYGVIPDSQKEKQEPNKTMPQAAKIIKASGTGTILPMADKEEEKKTEEKKTTTAPPAVGPFEKDDKSNSNHTEQYGVLGDLAESRFQETEKSDNAKSAWQTATENRESNKTSDFQWYSSDKSEQLAQAVEIGKKAEEKKATEKTESTVRDASFWDLTVNSLKRGYTQSLYGQESYKAMLGQKNNKAYYEEKLKSNDFSFIPDTWYEKALSGAMELLGQQWKQWTDGRSLAAGTGMAVTAALAGQAGPQVFLPEEVITVPGAFFSGIALGSATANLEIEAGLAYNEMVENGISPETARKIALGVGVGNAALEMVQADELIKSFKILDTSDATSSVAKKIASYLAKRGVNVATETTQEVGQEAITLAGLDAARGIEGKDAIYSWKEIGQRIGETAASSALSFGLLGTGGDTIKYTAGKTASAVLNPNKGNAETTGSVSVGDAFSDSKSGDTIAVVERNNANTTVEINNGVSVERRVVTNAQADTLASDNQYSPVNVSASSANVTAAEKSAVSIGDTFSDSKSGNTITVVAQNGENTTVEINNGTSVERKVVTNEQANTLASNSQYVPVNASASVAETPAAPSATTQAAVSVGDVFHDTKWDNTITVVAQDSDGTVVEISNGVTTERKVFTNAQTDTLALSEQYEKVKAGDAPNVNTQQYSGANTPTEAFMPSEDGNLRFNQLELDYSDKTVREGNFRIRGEGTAVQTVDGHTYGKYGVYKKASTKKYAVALLQSGLDISQFDTLDEAQKVAAYLDDNIPFNDIIYTTGSNGEYNAVRTDEFKAYLGAVRQVLETKPYDAAVSEEVAEVTEVTEDTKMYRIMEENGLTSEEQDGMMKYKSSESYDINDALRSGTALTPEQKSTIESVNSALSKFPAYEGTVYRNIGFIWEEDFNDLIASHEGKQTITYPAFTSTSKSVDGYKVSAPYLVHYEIKSVTGADVSELGITQENEVLFKTDTAFDIVSFAKNGNTINIVLEERVENGKNESNGPLEDQRNQSEVERDGGVSEHRGQYEEIHSPNSSVRGRGTVYDRLHSEESGSDRGRVERGTSSEDKRSNGEIGNDSGREGLLQGLTEETSGYEADIKTVAWESLNPRQRKAATFMEGLAKAANLDLVLTANAPFNGAYDIVGNTLYLDVFAGTDPTSKVNDIIIPTASHELTHWMEFESPELWNRLSSSVFSALESVDGISEADRITNEMARLKRKKRVANEKVARSEIVARACEDMLSQSEQGKKMFESLSESDQKTLRDKIKDIISNLKDWISEMLGSYKSNSYEARTLRKCEEKVNEIAKLWDEAFAKSAEVSRSQPKATEITRDEALNQYGIQFDDASESIAPTTLFSERTWNASEYVQNRDVAVDAIVKALDVSRADAERYVDNINSVARLIADDRARLDYDSNIDEYASVLKKNKEYKWSVDMSTLCAKRLLYTGTFDAIQKTLPNKAFTSEDMVALRSMMRERGYEVACGICYVESTRRELGTITADFIERYKLAQQTGKPITRVNSEGKVVELRKTQEQMETTMDKSTDKFYADKDYTPTLAELNATDIDRVKVEHPLVYEAYLQYMNARGQAKPKLLETRTEYKGEILKTFKDKQAVASRNAAGGLRVQSFSDFEVAHLIDMMQIALDMSRVGLMSQAYTKVPAFADVFGDTGIKINLSLIAKDSGLDENGNLIFDDVEGMPAEEAFRLREKHSKNVGTILVGKNDDHIKAALADSRIDYIIPYHKSFWKESLYDALGLNGYEDYTETQNEKPLDKSRKIHNFQPSEYWDYSKSGDENAKVYLEMCKRDGRTPKFPQFIAYPGYWKLLIDFKMYDNDGAGSPQEVVKPEFDMEAANRVMNEYKGGHQNFPVAQDVVDDFVAQYGDEVLLSEKNDAEYLELAKNPEQNEARLRELVDTAAKNAGYSIRGLHSTNAEFTVFDIDKTYEWNFHGKGIYFTNSLKDLENNYENYEGPDPWEKVEARAYELADEKYGLSYEDTLTSEPEIVAKLNECFDEAIEEFNRTQRRITAYLKFDNPLVLEKGDSSNYVLDGYDGIIDKQVYENIGHSGMDENTIHYVVLNPRNIKSDALVTYDDNGNVIPLSERFNAENDDIRYSLKDDGIPDLFEAWDMAENTEAEKVEPAKEPTKDSGVKAEKRMATQNTTKENAWVDEDATTTPAPEDVPSISELMKEIGDAFGITVKSGKVMVRDASGVYKVTPEVIRTRGANRLPTVIHELGHHLNKHYHFENSQHISEAELIVDSDFLNQYPDADKPGELAAEFVRRYFKNPEAVTKACPNLTNDFLSALSKQDAKSVNRIADRVHTYLSAEASDRYGATIIDSKQAKRLDKEDLRDQAHELYTKWIDGFHPIKQLVDFVEESTGKIALGTKNAYKLATNTLNAHTISNFVLLEKFRDLNGNILSGNKSFVECIKDVNLTDGKTRKNFSLYLKLKHALEVQANGKDVFADETLGDEATIKKQIAILDKAYPKFANAAENLYEFQHNVLIEYAVKSGLMTKEDADFLHKMYPNYVPFYRYKKGRKNSFSRNSIANQKSPVKRMKGSGLDTLDPLESIVKNTENIISAAIKHQTADLIGRYADTVDGIGAFIERVPPDQVAKKVDITALKEEFNDRLQSLVKSSDDYFAVSDLLDEVFGDEVMGYNPVVNERERIILVQRGDERAYYQVHNEALFEAITELSPKQASGLLNTLGRAMSTTNALITQFNPLFAVANPIRDIMTAYDLGNIDNPAAFIRDYTRALWYIMSGNDMYTQFRSMGGGHSSRLNADIGEISKSVKDIQMQDKGLARRTAYAITHHPIELLTAFADFTESIPRLMTFINTYEKTGDLQEAMYKADDITTNFKRRGSGKTAKAINSTFRFNNAALQGLDKTRRTLIGDGKKRTVQVTAKWLTTAILGALLRNFWNREEDEEGYENLSSYVKNNFYNFAMGDGQFLALPKERENAVIDSLVERTVDAMCGEDDAFYDFAGYVASQLLPPMIPGTLNPNEILPDWLNNTLAGPFTDIAANRDFKGSPIESDYDKDHVSSERYSEGTTKLAYALGQTKLAVDADLSPKKIDHLLSSFGFLATANEALFPVSESRKDVTLGLRNRFIKDSSYSTDVINKVYDNRDLAERDFNYHISAGDATIEDAIEYERNSVVSSYISGMNKAIRALPDDEQRRGRGYLLQMLNRWDYGNTSSQTDMTNKLYGENILDADCIITSVPKSELTWSENKKNAAGKNIKGPDGKYVKTKYSYQMTPQEYHEYITDYLSMVDKYRMYVGNNASGMDEYLSGLSATKTEVNKKFQEKYESKYKSKATISE